jgi:hypothetical protein
MSGRDWKDTLGLNVFNTSGVIGTFYGKPVTIDDYHRDEWLRTCANASAFPLIYDRAVERMNNSTCQYCGTNPHGDKCTQCGAPQ